MQKLFIKYSLIKCPVLYEENLKLVLNPYIFYYGLRFIHVFCFMNNLDI